MTRATCVFCSILRGEAHADVVFADEVAWAFLDAKPLFPGHVLVIPTTHRATLVDLPVADVGPFFERVQRVTFAVEQALGAEGTFVAANNRVSQSVPHLHVHVVPRRRKDGLRGFFWPRKGYATDTERREVAARVRAALESAS